MEPEVGYAELNHSIWHRHFKHCLLCAFKSTDSVHPRRSPRWHSIHRQEWLERPVPNSVGFADPAAWVGRLAMDNQPLGEWQIAQVPKAMAIKAQFRLVSIGGQSLKSDAGRQRRVSFQPIYVCMAAYSPFSPSTHCRAWMPTGGKSLVAHRNSKVTNPLRALST